MSPYKFKKLFVEDHFDKDNDLEIQIEDDGYYSEWLPREEVISLRDHLNGVLGVAQ